MGTIYSVTCKNKDCRYHSRLHSGVGMLGFARLHNYEKALLSGDITNNDVLDRLANGAHIRAGGIYLCPACKELISDGTFYLIENLTYSPYGTARYDVSFPFGEPVCKTCGSKLEFIRNVLSSKLKCPRCNNELKSRPVGNFD
jgi:hypothetical protein